jgi:hypothetical protein
MAIALNSTRHTKIDGYRLWVKRGNRTGTFYGNKTYKWHGTVVNENGKVIWRGKVDKKISWKSLLNLATKKVSTTGDENERL